MMTIQINGVYECENGSERYYVFAKVRKFYVVLMTYTGTGFIAKVTISKKYLESCKYIGQASSTWENLFKVVGE